MCFRSLFHPRKGMIDEGCTEVNILLTVKWISTSSVVFLGPKVSIEP